MHTNNEERKKPRELEIRKADNLTTSTGPYESDDIFYEYSEINEKLFSETERWKAIKDLREFFIHTINNIPAPKYILEGKNYKIAKKNPVKLDIFKEINEAVKILEERIENPYYGQLFGPINMQGIRYLIKILKNKEAQFKKLRGQELKMEFYTFIQDYLNLCSAAFSSGDVSSEPVREQFFNNICDTLNIPPYPLERLDRIYDEFKDPEKRTGINMSEVINRALKDEIEKQKGVQIDIERMNTKLDTKRIRYFKSPEDEKEAIDREWDFWKTMDKKKYLIRQSKMQSLKKLIDGETDLEEMKKESDKYTAIKSWKMN